MPRSTKEQARKTVDTYGRLLLEHGLISTIETEEVRDKIRYTFTLFDSIAPYEVQCEGINELARVLSSMWSTYDKAKRELGLTE